MQKKNVKHASKENYEKEISQKQAELGKFVKLLQVMNKGHFELKALMELAIMSNL